MTWIIAIAVSILLGHVFCQDEILCGRSRPPTGEGANWAMNSRVIGGNDVIPGLLPWMLRLERTDPDSADAEHVCGAVLIDVNYALTSARCFYDMDITMNVQVVAGSYNVNNLTGFEQYLDIETVFIHPNFNNSADNFPNDIAIIALNQSADISDEAGPVDVICLPPSNDTVYWENPSCVMAGYGLADNETDDVPGALTQAWVDAIREIQCELWWSDDNFLLPTHQCAMDQITRSVSLCEGDVGSPLSCMVDGRFDLAGVGSFYSDGCNTRFPSVFTSIGPYLDWIEQITGVVPRPE